MSLIRRNACSSFGLPIWPAITVLVGSFWMAGLAVAADATSAGDAELFSRLDANHDGAIGAAEVTSENRALFERLLRRADANHDKSLSREEFLASLVPSRPERPVEAKEPANTPGADAVRYMLLKLDANKNARVEKDEVPKELRPIFEILLERLDNNGDGQMDRQELSRSGPGLAQIAGRYVEREGIDVKTELPKLQKAQGVAASRFDDTGGPMERLGDPSKVRQMFKELDTNNDGYLTEKEVSEVFRERADRFTTMSDRDRDGRLSEREFVEGAERVSKFLGRQLKDDRKDLKAKKKNERKLKSAESPSPGKN
jgi:Ca2+-binding EF-hand superfamily protein